MAMARKHGFNAEKLVFFVCALLLALSTWQFKSEESAHGDTGPHKVAVDRPDRIEVQVEDLTKNKANFYALGLRDNPFNVYWYEGRLSALEEQRLKFSGRSLPPRTAKSLPRRAVQKKPPPPQPKKPPKTAKTNKAADNAPRIPRPYDLPVEMSGSIVIAGRNSAIFRDKDSGQLYKVRDGDRLDDIGLQILRVSRTGVLVEDDDGQRFLIRKVEPAPPADDEAMEEG